MKLDTWLRIEIYSVEDEEWPKLWPLWLVLVTFREVLFHSEEWKYIIYVKICVYFATFIQFSVEQMIYK